MANRTTFLTVSLSVRASIVAYVLGCEKAVCVEIHGGNLCPLGYVRPTSAHNSEKILVIRIERYV